MNSNPLQPAATALDGPERYDELRALIERKPALRAFYSEIYAKYRACLERCPKDGDAVELGSGGGFTREALPGVITSDVVAYSGVDRVIDATEMPFADSSLRAIFMLNVFHHVPDVAAFLREAARCLKPGGRVLLVDQHVGWISGPILKYAHHEPFDSRAGDWRFETTGPLSGANGALTWIVFKRDRERFLRENPALELVRYEPHSPLRYWLAGGLKSWSLLPGPLFGLATAFDHALARAVPPLGSFVDVELLRR
jgi:SAM-dependent methyltransferase